MIQKKKIYIKLQDMYGVKYILESELPTLLADPQGEISSLNPVMIHRLEVWWCCAECLLNLSLFIQSGRQVRCMRRSVPENLDEA
jgi:hypothetical protein